MESRHKLTICRLCICENECFINIFEPNDWQGYVAAEVISDLLRFQVSETDGYPHVVCSKCLVKLTEFKLFKERCQESIVKYDDMFTSSEALLDQQETVEFVAVKAEPIFYSDNEDYVSKDIGDGGSDLELCQKDPLGEASSHAELIESGPSGNSGTVQSTATVMENSPMESGEWRPAPFAGRKERFQCQTCKKVLKTKNGLKTHLAAHGIGKFYKCTVCSKFFGSRAGLVNHSRIHTGEKPFMCDECSASFTEYKHLKEHMRVHSKLNKFVCKECGSRFSYQCSLTRHMSVHTNLMPFSCNLCHANFSGESALRNHMTVHEVEKVFACDACSKRYGPRAIFKGDVVVQTGGSPHKCSYCGKQFRWKVSLDKHLKNV